MLVVLQPALEQVIIRREAWAAAEQAGEELSEVHEKLYESRYVLAAVVALNADLAYATTAGGLVCNRGDVDMAIDRRAAALSTASSAVMMMRGFRPVLTAIFRPGYWPSYWMLLTTSNPLM